MVDPESRAIDVWRPVDGEWELGVRLDDTQPAAEVELAGITVPLDLHRILRG